MGLKEYKFLLLEAEGIAKGKNIHGDEEIAPVAIDTAEVFAKSKEFETSYVYHQKMLETQKQIQKGECLYEF